MINDKQFEACYTRKLKFDATTFDESIWRKCQAAEIKSFWSGDVAPPERHVQARVVWTDAALCVRFDGAQHEPLITGHTTQTATKTIGLWNRDVCEVFLAPFEDEPYKYFEFEVAPTGEWLDLEIEWSGRERRTNWDYASGMQVLTRVATYEICLMMRVEWRALRVACPKAGDVWRVNFFRCIGGDEMTRYLAWRPTRTAKPNFHIPGAFGELRFQA